MTVILYPYTDVRKANQRDSLLALLQVQRIWGDCLQVVKMTDDTSYWRLLAKYWLREDIIIIEQDIVPRPFSIYQLACCPLAPCTYPYRLKSGHWALFDIGPNNETLFHDEITEYSEASGLGLVKLTKTIQTLIPLEVYDVEHYKWWYLDTFISKYLKMNSILWHVHQPEVRHTTDD